MMRVDLKITTAIASALLAGACHQDDNGWTTDRDTAVCVDKDGRRVPDAQCPHPGYTSGGGGNAFLWYYLGRNSALPYYGEPVRGGSFARAPGATYFAAPASTGVTRSAAIARGGFGSSAASAGEGAGE